MKWKVVFLSVLVAIGGYSLYHKPAPTTYTQFHHPSFNEKDFYGDVENSVPKINITDKIYGGILSHHIYVAPELAQYFSAFKNTDPEVVVLVGPNHYSLGTDDVVVSRLPYKTPWGILEPESKIIEKLLQNDFVKNNERPFELEHSIAANVAYIKRFFPRAKFVPIILKKTTPQSKLDSLAKDLEKILPANSIVLASVDFSHHGKEITSKFHDDKSIAAIQSFDFESISKLEIDSPPSIYTLLKYLESKEAYRMDYWNTNSALFGANPTSEDVTSYVFAYFTKGPKENNEKVSVLNFGDMIFDRGVRSSMEKGMDPFEYIKGVEGNFLKGVDFVIANLEGPIIETERKNCQDKAYSFQFPLTIAKLLQVNNFNLVNIANNHSFDCYEAGVSSTKVALGEYGIAYMGDRSLDKSYVLKTVGSKKVAFVGIDTFTTPIPVESFYPLIKKLKTENDYVIVNIHWGYEYDLVQSKTQEEIAYALIDNGTDIIFGHHPHVIQPVEIYKDGVIFYSLGNFIFDQLTKETNTGIGAGAVLGEYKIDFYIFPFNIIRTRPKLMEYVQMNEFCEVYLKGIESSRGCAFSLGKNP